MEINIYFYLNYLFLIILFFIGEERPLDAKSNKNVYAMRKQRRHTIADQTSLSFIKPMGLWKQSRKQSMFKNNLPTVSMVEFYRVIFYN